MCKTLLFYQANLKLNLFWKKKNTHWQKNHYKFFLASLFYKNNSNSLLQLNYLLLFETIFA